VTPCSFSFEDEVFTGGFPDDLTPAFGTSAVDPGDSAPGNTIGAGGGQNCHSVSLACNVPAEPGGCVPGVANVPGLNPTADDAVVDCCASQGAEIALIALDYCSWAKRRNYYRRKKDFWALGCNVWVRHHMVPRRVLYIPEPSWDGPDVKRLSPRRVTIFRPHGAKLVDDWWSTTLSSKASVFPLWTGITVFTLSDDDSHACKLGPRDFCSSFKFETGTFFRSGL